MSHKIAIDGPAGAGKSTIAKQIAKQLGFIYVDTGAMYRAMALYLLEQQVPPDNEELLEKACKNADISIAYQDGEQQVLLNGMNVTSRLREEAVGNMASVSSANAKVREKLVELQQRLAKKADVVMDGRDIGTKVLPDAETKIYLTASSAVRAKRRFMELQAQGDFGDLAEIEADIIKRDNRDMTRKISPLKQAEDAVLLDTSHMTAEEVAAAIIKIYGEQS